MEIFSEEDVPLSKRRKESPRSSQSSSPALRFTIFNQSSRIAVELLIICVKLQLQHDGKEQRNQTKIWRHF